MRTRDLSKLSEREKVKENGENFPRKLKEEAKRSKAKQMGVEEKVPLLLLSVPFLIRRPFVFFFLSF